MPLSFGKGIFYFKKRKNKMVKTELKKVKRLLKEVYEHLNYCGWGDSWEREGSKDLQKELDEYFYERSYDVY